MFQGKEDIGAIVADIGSTSARIGFAGDDVPRAYIPSVGKLQYVHLHDTNLYFIVCWSDIWSFTN